MAKGSERQIRTKRWVCHICAEHAPEYPALGLPGCTGKPLRGYPVDGLPVCETAAIYHANMEFLKHRRMIRELADHPAIRGGETRKSLMSLLRRFREAITLELSGANTGGVANLTKVSERIADFFAEARFVICFDLLQGAKQAVQELAARLPAGKVRAVESILATAESDLVPYGLDPTALSTKDRRAYWGAAKRSAVFLLGDPRKEHDTLEDKIRKIAGVDAAPFLREFRVRQIMAAFRIPREEAELVAERGLDALQSIVEAPSAKGTEAVVAEVAVSSEVAVAAPVLALPAPAASPTDGAKHDPTDEAPDPENTLPKEEAPSEASAEPEADAPALPAAGPPTAEAPKRSRATARKNGGADGEVGGKTKRPHNGEPPERAQIAEGLEVVAGMGEPPTVNEPADKGNQADPPKTESPFAQLSVAANGDVTLRGKGQEGEK